MEEFKRARSFNLSDHKIIFWSKRNIYHANIPLRSTGLHDANIYLIESQFEIMATKSMEDKKVKKVTKAK